MRTLMSAPPTDRIGRYPKHTFFVESQPFVLQPFFMARVLPGETLTNLYFECRSVVRGLVSPIIGWKQQQFFFYVRATDLMQDAFKQMFIDPENADLIASTALEDATGNLPTFCAPGAIDWTLLALQKVTEHYFRDDGEAWNSNVYTNGLPIAQIREATWMDSLMLASELPEGEEIAEATDLGDLERLMDAFEALRAMGIANMSYEDWLRSQGIAIPTKDESKPELLQVWSEFTYPVNTIDPTTGTPSSAASWVWKKSAKERKFFKEPGFLIGVTVTRPKVYLNTAGSLAGFATRAWDWMPNYLRTMPETTLKPFADNTGPVPTAGAAYVADMRDELVHGDQFIYSPGSTIGDHWFDIPDSVGGVQWRYPATAEIDALATSAIENDGFVSLNIKGFEVDYTQANIAEV